MAGWVLAVDFGTSNTAAAHTGPVSGVVETLPLSHSSNLMSSSVFVTPGEQIVVGDVALNASATNPGAFVSAPKRAVKQGSMQVNFVEVRVSEMVSAVLRAVLARGVAQHDGALPDLLVLTHPVAWSPEELDVLRDAAVGAGVAPEQVRLIAEPDAAAHYYTRSETKLSPGEMIAVFDYGGGTLDVAVLAATDTGTFTVLAARGDNARGGKNLDALIRRWVDQQLEDHNPGLRVFLQRDAPTQVLRALDDSIRGAKELLSEAPRATVTVKARGETVHLDLTRGELEEIIGEEMDAGVDLINQTFKAAGITGADLKTLYLTGGSSRIPLVHKRLEDIATIATLDDPKTVVAQGSLIASDAFVAGDPTAPSPLDTWRATSASPAQPAPRAVSAEPHGWRGRIRPVASIAGLALVLTVAAGVVLLKGSTSGAQQTAPPPATSDPVAVITAALPDQLRKDSTCIKSGFTDSGSLRLQCDLAASSVLLQGASVPHDGPLSYSVTVDLPQARRELAMWRNAATTATRELVESKQGNAGAQIDSATGTDPGTVYVGFADRDTGLDIGVHVPGTVTDAKAFLHKSGLI